MAAIGSRAKAEITEKILNYFPNSFVNEKEIRIPFTEDGVERQIKVTLTTAKENISVTPAVSRPAAASTASDADVPWFDEVPVAAPSQDEKDKLKELLASF